MLSRVVRWRVGLPWYLIALGLPTVLSIATAGLGYLLGASESIQVGALTVLELVLFVLVVGEELGWRGYALPLLLEKRSAVTASLILGALWGLWHLPTFLVPGTLSTVCFDGVRAADHRVLDLDDVGFPPYARQRPDRHPVPRRHQSLPGHLPGRHGRCRPVLAAEHRVRRRGAHRGRCARVDRCKAGERRVDYFLINFPEPLISCLICGFPL